MRGEVAIPLVVSEDQQDVGTPRVGAGGRLLWGRAADRGRSQTG